MQTCAGEIPAAGVAGSRGTLPLPGTDSLSSGAVQGPGWESRAAKKLADAY